MSQNQVAPDVSSSSGKIQSLTSKCISQQMLSPIRNFAEGNGNIFHVSNTTPTNTPSTGAPLPVKFSISLPLPDPPTGHDGHIRRPRNAFFLFRSDFKLENDRRDEQDRIKSQAVLSRMAGELWGTLDDKAKHIYKLRAEKEAHQHIKTYPGYRYNPLPRKAPARTEYNGLKRRKPVRKEGVPSSTQTSRNSCPH